MVLWAPLSVMTHCCAAVVADHRVSAVPSAFEPRYLRLVELTSIPMVAYVPMSVTTHRCLAPTVDQRLAEVPSWLSVR